MLFEHHTKTQPHPQNSPQHPLAQQTPSTQKDGGRQTARFCLRLGGANSGYVDVFDPANEVVTAIELLPGMLYALWWPEDDGVGGHFGVRYEHTVRECFFSGWEG